MSERSRPARRRTRLLRLALGAAAVAVLSADATRASAEATEPANATGPCTGEVIIPGYETIDPYRRSGVYTIPLSGTGTYTGAVDSPGDDIRPIKGEVKVVTPRGLPNIQLIDAWKWDGSGPGRTKTGEVDWDLPSALPRGVPIKVEGYHQEPGIRCEGDVKVEIEGGVFDSPLGAAALGGTVLALAGLGFAMVPKRGGAA